jgi:ribonuclease E
LSEGAVVEGQDNAVEMAANAATMPTGEAGEELNAERSEPRRSRDRYGRDRRDRPARDEAPAGAGAQPTDVVPPPGADDTGQAERRPRYATGFVEENGGAPASTEAAAPVREQPVIAPIAVQAPAPVAAPVAAAKPAEAASSNGLPKVTPFQLPVDQLAQVAAGSGLQWVNSDAEKIAAVQAAIAAEPKPIRVPRERPPAVVIDEGPLVLVETRRDLGEMKLPFEQQPPTTPLQ